MRPRHPVVGEIQLVTAEKRDAGKMQEQVVLTKVIAYIQPRSHAGGCEFPARHFALFAPLVRSRLGRSSLTRLFDEGSIEASALDSTRPRSEIW